MWKAFRHELAADRSLLEPLSVKDLGSYFALNIVFFVLWYLAVNPLAHFWLRRGTNYDVANTALLNSSLFALVPGSLLAMFLMAWFKHPSVFFRKSVGILGTITLMAIMVDFGSVKLFTPSEIVVTDKLQRKTLKIADIKRVKRECHIYQPRRQNTPRVDLDYKIEFPDGRTITLIGNLHDDAALKGASFIHSIIPPQPPTVIDPQQFQSYSLLDCKNYLEQTTHPNTSAILKRLFGL